MSRDTRPNYSIRLMYDGTTARTCSDKDLRFVEWGTAWDGEPYRVTEFDENLYIYWGIGAALIGEKTKRMSWDDLYKAGKDWLDNYK